METNVLSKPTIDQKMRDRALIREHIQKVLTKAGVNRDLFRSEEGEAEDQIIQLFRDFGKAEKKDREAVFVRGKQRIIKQAAEKKLGPSSQNAPVETKTRPNRRSGGSWGL